MDNLEALLTQEELDTYCEALVEAESIKQKLKQYKHNNDKQKVEKDF